LTIPAARETILQAGHFSMTTPGQFQATINKGDKPRRLRPPLHRRRAAADPRDVCRRGYFSDRVAVPRDLGEFRLQHRHRGDAGPDGRRSRGGTAGGHPPLLHKPSGDTLCGTLGRHLWHPGDRLYRAGDARRARTQRHVAVDHRRLGASIFAQGSRHPIKRSSSGDVREASSSLPRGLRPTCRRDHTHDDQPRQHQPQPRADAKRVQHGE